METEQCSQAKNTRVIQQNGDNTGSIRIVDNRANGTRKNETGLPDNLKAGVESLSGFSLDNVRVHYNSSKPATVQALAYTQGTDIHVAPGQEKHLPHEAWHVAQQMAGRVSPTTNINGMPVNDNAALEHEADVMGEKAAGLEADVGQNTIREGTVHSAIQRKIGFEFENGKLRTIEKKEGGEIKKMAKGQVLCDLGEGTRITADDLDSETSDLEIVTAPFDNERTALDSVGGAYDRVAELTEYCQTHPKYWIDNKFRIIKNEDEGNYSAQATIAIPLEIMSAVMGKARKRVLGKVFNTEEYKKRGFMDLVAHYLDHTVKERDELPIYGPKSKFWLMARNDFASLFALSGITRQEWEGTGDYSYKRILGKFSDLFKIEAPGAKRMFPAGVRSDYFYGESSPDFWHVEQDRVECSLTAEQWLRSIPDVDLLKGGENNTFEGMGAMGSNYEDDVTPIFEVRDSSPLGFNRVLNGRDQVLDYINAMFRFQQEMLSEKFNVNYANKELKPQTLDIQRPENEVEEVGSRYMSFCEIL